MSGKAYITPYSIVYATGPMAGLVIVDFISTFRGYRQALEHSRWCAQSVNEIGDDMRVGTPRPMHEYEARLYLKRMEEKGRRDFDRARISLSFSNLAHVLDDRKGGRA